MVSNNINQETECGTGNPEEKGNKNSRISAVTPRTCGAVIERRKPSSWEKSVFLKKVFFFKDRKHQSYWLKPDDKHTKIPERAWDAWCREYDKFFKEIL